MENSFKSASSPRPHLTVIVLLVRCLGSNDELPPNTILFTSTEVAVALSTGDIFEGYPKNWVMYLRKPGGIQVKEELSLFIWLSPPFWICFPFSWQYHPFSYEQWALLGTGLETCAFDWKTIISGTAVFTFRNLHILSSFPVVYICPGGGKISSAGTWCDPVCSLLKFLGAGGK